MDVHFGSSNSASVYHFECSIIIETPRSSLKLVNQARLNMPIKIPDWVPISVQELIRELETELREQHEPDEQYIVLERLACSDPMEKVWRELSRRQCKPPERLARPALDAATRMKSSGPRKAFYAKEYDVAKLWREETARIAKGLPDENTVATRILFRQAFWQAFKCGQPLYARDKIQWRSDLEKCLCDLRQVSSRLRRHNLPRALDASLSLSEEISAIMRTHPALEQDFHPGVFIRATKNGPQRAYAVGLTSITLGLFGMRLYGTIANLANAVFNRGDIDADRIRQWVHPNR